ncbi:PREDICTED: uncharacterized protein LOC106123387 isoform X2 [Papilio xuthus]|uniref:Uncharacterized protein LOC106123387 isoform X2 n=1 Tax=Papilio xuthus TaxID=66420 RepID=A0AAJ7EFB6_PAPXU|nr:PREDICTED: uncharacterized protein LOC106123387 isoform X2 [Papilio xuthus]
MPASSIDLFHMQDAKNNFNAMRPAPVCSDTTNQLMGHCHNVHISKSCYYGYQETKNSENVYNTDCEMKEAHVINDTSSSPKNGKKRCAEYFVYPESKRLREEGMVPTTSTHNPRLLRPTHNNPDISRCLMVHMI